MNTTQIIIDGYPWPWGSPFPSHDIGVQAGLEEGLILYNGTLNRLPILCVQNGFGEWRLMTTDEYKAQGLHWDQEAGQTPPGAHQPNPSYTDPPDRRMSNLFGQMVANPNQYLVAPTMQPGSPVAIDLEGLKCLTINPDTAKSADRIAAMQVLCDLCFQIRAGSTSNNYGPQAIHLYGASDFARSIFTYPYHRHAGDTVYRMVPPSSPDTDPAVAAKWAELLSLLSAWDDYLYFSEPWYSRNAHFWHDSVRQSVRFRDDYAKGLPMTWFLSPVFQDTTTPVPMAWFKWVVEYAVQHEICIWFWPGGTPAATCQPYVDLMKQYILPK